MTHTQPPRLNLAHALERILAILAAAACVFLTIGLWLTVSTNQAIWPLPGLYFVELAALAILVAVLLLRGHRWSATGAWVASGIYLAFMLLGAFTIGLFYLPIVMMFAMLAVLSTIRQEQSVWKGIGALLLGALGQAIVMGTLVRLL